MIAPGDASFGDARLPWNRAVVQQPTAVVHPADADDCVALVAAARSAGLPVALQPTGHGATRAVDGCLLVRPDALDEVRVDADAGVARVGAGVRWGTLLAALDGTGLVGLAGGNPGVSVVGYLLGAGMSWFGRRHGVASGSLRAVELVDGRGEVRRVTDRSDPELMWALRGGGGELGLVTSVEIDLPWNPSCTAAHSPSPCQTPTR